MGWTALLLTYLLGGVTFIPLVVLAIFVHGYYTLPDRPDLDHRSRNSESAGNAGRGGDDDRDSLVQPGDDVEALKAAQKLARDEAARARAAHHDSSDVAAGYFAVCREYAPMGINAKPIERLTPVGSATVAAPSPSVYQTMYRSIFDRKQTSSPLDNKSGASQRPRKAGNVFYVVLRHGHIMLFDDDEQLEVRHVISLAHHEVSIFSGEDEPTPEGELYIKKNAICLTRKASGPEMGPDTQVSKPFYLFSENCSAKEDFYFSLLRNQEHSFRGEEAGDEAPRPLQFDVKHIIGLVQKLHSSEDHLQTRWLNALIGRMFLGVYRTKDLENFIREKLTKKISRVKRPSFLSGISIQKIETGDSAPYITNPRLKDLTVEGECGLEADVKYTGNFRIEVAATARIDLGSRFKAREVNLVLAVVLRKLEGHILLKIKPPPSNRLWVSFQHMPKMEMTLEPIISSKQITYTVILRQIESRIKEVVAETLVFPFWDDTPFFGTEHKQWRGGIFEGDDAVVSSTDIEKLNAQIDETDEVIADGAANVEDHQSQASSPVDIPHMEKSHSLPVVERTGLFGRKLNGKAASSASSTKAAFSTSSASVDTKASAISAPAPRATRSGSFTGPPEPVVGTDATHADLFKPSSSPPNSSPAAQAMASLSAKSGPVSPGGVADATPSRPSRAAVITSKISSGRASRGSSRSGGGGTDSDKEPQDYPTLKPSRRQTTSSTGSGRTDEDGQSTRGSIKSQAGTLTRNFFLRTKPSLETISVGEEGSSSEPPLQSPKRNNTISAVTAAAVMAKRWGMNAFQRNGGGDANHHRSSAGGGAGGTYDGGADAPLDLSKPMGGGRPLPPPGVPLPMPDKKGKITSIPVPKRKPVPMPQPQVLRKANGNGGSSRGHGNDGESSSSAGSHKSVGGGGKESGQQRRRLNKIERRPVPPPPLAKRMHMMDAPGSPVQNGGGGGEDMLLVVAAPADSEPNSPLPSEGGGSPTHETYGRHPWAEDDEDVSGVRGEHGAVVDEARGLHDDEHNAEETAYSHADADNGDDEDDEGFSAWMNNGEMDDVDIPGLDDESPITGTTASGSTSFGKT